MTAMRGWCAQALFFIPSLSLESKIKNPKSFGWFN
jgi:hypothetical protein